MRQQYLSLVLLAMIALFGAGCDALNPPQPTAIPFQQLSAEDVFNAFARAGLQLQNPQKEMIVQGRGAPTQFADRYVFEIPRVAPAGGQVLVFSDAAQLQAWQEYIDRLRNDSATRRDVVYVYVNQNVMLQLSASLTNLEASAYRDAFMGIQ